MNAVIHPPLHAWTRHYPTARRIAAALLADPNLLNLRSRRLESDIRQRFAVGSRTAWAAIGIARRAVQRVGDSRETQRTER